MKLPTHMLDRLSLVLAGLTVACCLCASIIYLDPGIFFNVLEPSRVGPRIVPSLTATRFIYPTFPPAWTSTPAASATATQAPPTPSPTASLTPTATASGPARTQRPSASPTRTRTPTATPKR